MYGTYEYSMTVIKVYETLMTISFCRFSWKNTIMLLMVNLKTILIFRSFLIWIFLGDIFECHFIPKLLVDTEE